MAVINSESDYQNNLKHNKQRQGIEEEPLTESLERVLGYQNISGFLCEVKSDGRIFWRDRIFDNKEAFDKFINLSK